MLNEDDIDFRDHLERVIRDKDALELTLTLLSGDKFIVTDRDELFIGKRTVSLLTPNGTESFFPFEAICNVDIRYR